MQSKIFTPYILFVLALGAIPMTAQTPFFAETFSDEATALSEWIAGGENEGTETWRWSSDPGEGGFLDFTAPTAGSGFLFFNSDANGQNEHAVTLTSPVIDCSGRERVFLEMYTQYIYYFFNFSQVELGVSINGADFLYQDILTDVPPVYLYPNAQRVVLEIPDAINQANVRLQIKWTGFFEYFLNIDDIALYETAPILPNDLQIEDLLYPLSYQTPISQVDSVFFLGIARNIGADPQTNLKMRTTVLDGDFNQVHQDSVDGNEMLATGALDTLIIEEGFQPSTLGTHFVFQSLEADEEDDFRGNNREVFTFQITEDTYAVDDDDLQAVFAPGGVGEGQFYDGGNFYYVKNGSGYQADFVEFAVASNGNAHIGETVTVLLFEVSDDGEPGFSSDDLINVGFGTYTFQQGDNNFTPVLAELSEDGVSPGVPLKDSTEYLLFVSLPQNIGLAYTYRELLYEVGSVIRIGDDFFGRFSDSDGGEIPLAFYTRMIISESQPNAVKEPELADSRINAFPNPVRDFYRIDLDLEKTSAVQLQLMNLAGQLLLQREYTALQRDRIDLDLRALPAGAYLVKVRTDEGVKTLKLTRQ